MDSTDGTNSMTTDELRASGDEQTPAGTQPAAPAAVDNTEALDARGAPAAEDSQSPASHDRAAELEQQIAELERQLAAERDAAADYMQRLQRAQADFSNFRRRAQQEQEQREALATGRALAAVLPALDSFQRAFSTLPQTLRALSWIDGIALVELQFHRALDALGVQPIEAAPGQPFDPMRHESIGEVESGDHPSGHVAVVVQQGYELRGLVLRPVLVQLARERTESATSGSDQPQQAASAEGSEASGAEDISP